MSAYEKFAQVYDLFMDNIDYEGWAEYVTDRLREYEITDGLVLELGCGTGTMTGLLAGKGYDMFGVDNSCISCRRYRISCPDSTLFSIASASISSELSTPIIS